MNDQQREMMEYGLFLLAWEPSGFYQKDYDKIKSVMLTVFNKTVGEQEIGMCYKAFGRDIVADAISRRGFFAPPPPYVPLDKYGPPPWWFVATLILFLTAGSSVIAITVCKFLFR